jgi:hypothetical protein
MPEPMRIRRLGLPDLFRSGFSEISPRPWIPFYGTTTDSVNGPGELLSLAKRKKMNTPDASGEKALPSTLSENGHTQTRRLTSIAMSKMRDRSHS